MKLPRLLKDRVFQGFCFGVFVGSSCLGFLSFGPLIVVLFPITFFFGLAVGLVTVGPWVYLLFQRGFSRPLPYVIASAVVGAVATIAYGVGSELFAVGGLSSFELTPSLLLMVPVVFAYALGGYVFWAYSISKS